MNLFFSNFGLLGINKILFELYMKDKQIYELMLIQDI